MTIDLKMKTYEELQFEVARLITDNYVKQQKIEYLQNRITELEEINKQHQEINSELRTKIGKAVEYIKNNSLYTEDYDYDEEENLRWLGAHDYKESEDLLNILQDKEEV